jgi:hypothetical protein
VSLWQEKSFAPKARRHKGCTKKKSKKSIVLYFLHKLFFIYIKNKLDLMMITEDINSNFDTD